MFIESFSTFSVVFSVRWTYGVSDLRRESSRTRRRYRHRRRVRAILGPFFALCRIFTPLYVQILIYFVSAS